MPPKRSIFETDFAKLNNSLPHPLDLHRSIVTMGIGFAVLLAIMVTALSSTRVRERLIPSSVKHATRAQAMPTPVDTSSWISYTDEQTKLTFRHPTNWTVVSGKAGDGTLLTITSPKEAEGKISIYQSVEGFLGFEGLPEDKTKIANLDAVAIGSSLAGVKKDNTYFTFDAGLNQAAVPTFQEVLKSISF